MRLTHPEDLWTQMQSIPNFLLAPDRPTSWVGAGVLAQDAALAPPFS